MSIQHTQRQGTDMTTKLSTDLAAITDIPLQDASADIWDTKYRLKTNQALPLMAR